MSTYYLGSPTDQEVEAARERLARYLYLRTIDPDWRDHHALLWDRHSDRIDRDAVYTEADRILSVIAGKEA